MKIICAQRSATQILAVFVWLLLFANAVRSQSLVVNDSGYLMRSIRLFDIAI